MGFARDLRLMLLNKRLLNNAVFSALQTIVSAVLLFFLYRYLLNQLGAEQLGIWAIVLASTAIGRLTDMGFAGAVLKFVANSLVAGDNEKVARIIQTAAVSIALLLGLLAVAAFPLLELLLHWVLPDNAIQIAREILPFAIISLLFAMVSGIFQSGIDACHRMDIRNVLLISCNLIYIAATVVLVPSFGLKGVAVAQTIQSFLLLFSSFYVLRHLIPELPRIPFRWYKTEFREMVGYATNFQIGMLAGMFFDPVTKFFLAKYGDLSQTAYYEMANQLLQKARAVIVSAQQALVPEIASIRLDQQHSLVDLYKKAYGFSLILILPYYILIGLSLPIISYLWIGHDEPSFIVYGTLMTIGWFASNLSAIAYFYNIGTGALIWNTLDHILTGFINITLAAILGSYMGGVGIVVAAMLALLLANFMLVFVVQRRLSLPTTFLVPPEYRRYLLLLALGAVVASLMGIALESVTTSWMIVGVPPLVFSVVLLLVFSLEPASRQLLGRLRQRGNAS
ncbi:MAG: MATE family efflux transporter [Azonexus sp.]|nr:MATE family efflux transporter [Azonexus sp.]